MSTKLHRRPGPSRHDKHQNDRAISRSKPAQYGWSGFFQHFVEYFAPATSTYNQLQTNFSNLFYLGPIYMGSTQQEFFVVWDTGSGTLLLESSDCTNCSGDVFEIDESDTHAWVEPAAYDTVTYLDGTSLHGRLGTDKACPVEGVDEACADSYQFVAISDASGLGDETDGILGLWSGNKDEYDTTEMYMPSMKASSDIAEETFSFYMTGLDGQSYIDFGTPNESVMEGEPVYLDIQDNNYWWTQQLTGFRWNADFDTAQTEYAVTSTTTAITDTGSSCIVGPSQELGYIKGTILNVIAETKEVYTHQGWDYLFECPSADTLPSFEMLYGGYWFEVLPEDYLVDVSLASDGSLCSLCLTSIDGFYEWILGDVFMRGWYNIHEHETLRMGFVPFVGSAKSLPVEATTTPAETMPGVEINSITDILGIDATAFLAILGIAVGVTAVTMVVIIYCLKVLYTAKFQPVKAANKTLPADIAGSQNESAISLIYLQ